MQDVLVAVEMGAAMIAVPAAVLWLGRRARRRGIGGSVLAPLEEVWDPVAHRTAIEVQIQAEQEAPAPAPGDQPAASQAGTSTATPSAASSSGTSQPPSRG